MPAAPDGRAEAVWRRIPPRHKHAQQDRPNSDAFTNSVNDAGDPEGMSVVIERIADRIARTPVDVLAGHHGFGLVRIDAEVLHELGLVVTEDETKDEPAHGIVMLTSGRTQSRVIAKRCTWLIRIDLSNSDSVNT